jgi:hypothetical protein
MMKDYPSFCFHFTIFPINQKKTPETTVPRIFSNNNLPSIDNPLHDFAIRGFETFLPKPIMQNHNSQKISTAQKVNLRNISHS